MADRVMLDLPGLGIAQAYSHIGQRRPGFDAFAAWVTATAGPPDPVKVARVHAWTAGSPVLDAADLAHRDRHGYVVPRNAVTRAEAAVRLRGTADLWCSTDRMSVDPPETEALPFQGTPLHWDMSLVPPMPLLTCGILDLTDTAADHGALRVVPGFHRRIAGWLAEIGDADPRGIDLSAEAVPVPVGAGDLVVRRHELAHGAGRNRADRTRMAQYVNHHDADAVPQEMGRQGARVAPPPAAW